MIFDKTRRIRSNDKPWHALAKRNRSSFEIFWSSDSVKRFNSSQISENVGKGK